MLLQRLKQNIQSSIMPIPNERKEILQPLIEYIKSKIRQGQTVNLNFICTHNSRRSQLSQIWAKVAADYCGITVNTYSGGVEVTAFNPRAVDAIRRAGFEVEQEGENNPVYSIRYSTNSDEIKAYSKFYDDNIIDGGFVAIMNCAEADENCPFIPGAEMRIPIRYDDPKKYDDTGQEMVKYDERSWQIASEMFYALKAVSNGQ